MDTIITVDPAFTDFVYSLFTQSISGTQVTWGMLLTLVVVIMVFAKLGESL